MLETSLNPKRPLAIRIFNRVGPKISLDPKKLVMGAERRTKVGFPDAKLDHEALRRLLEGVENEANVHKFGRFLFKERLKGMLDTRLRLQYFQQKHPEILQEEIKAPFIIVGLPRSGTTFLHRLLAHHEQHRALVSWECLSPVPDPFSQKDNRQKLAKIGQKLVKYMAPHFFAIHPISFSAPEEEVLLTEAAFLSQVPEATFYLPKHAKWTAAQNHLPSYQLVKEVLQFLQWFEKPRTNRTWVLKTPQHLDFMPILLQVFPDARIVMTHRDPQQVMPSFASMMFHNRWMFSDRVDPVDCGQHWLQKHGLAMQKTMAFRKENPKVKFIDVGYRDLTQNPQETLEKILDKPLSVSEKDQFELFRLQNKQHKHGKHVYRKEDFGLHTENIKEMFADYLYTFSEYI